MRNLSVFLKEMEDGKYLPSTFVDFYSLTLLKDPRNVLVESAAGDVGDSVDIEAVDYFKDLLDIDPGRSKGDQAQRLVSPKFGIGLMKV